MTKDEAVTAIRELFADLDALTERNENQHTTIKNYKAANTELERKNTALENRVAELQSALSICTTAESAMEKKLFNATTELEELRRLNLELQKQLNPKDKNGRWVVQFFDGIEEKFKETVFSAPSHEYLNSRVKQYSANRWVITYQSPSTTVLSHGLC